MELSLRDRLVELFPLLPQVRGEAFVVGGAVRDLILGITPAEVDLAAFGAREVAESFATATKSRLVDLGRERFTTYRVIASSAEYDFSEIEGSFEADIHRRDCTMNAVAISVASGELTDLTGGVADAKRRVIRMIREQNYADDPLRIVKLVRLAVTRDCQIEPETFEAMRRNASALPGVAVERVTAELQKMLDDSRAHHGVALLRRLQLDTFLFGHECGDEIEQRVKTLLEGDVVTRFAALTRDLPDEKRKALTAQFKWAETQQRELEALVALTRDLAESGDAVLMKLHAAGRNTTERAVLLLGATGQHQASLRLAALLRERSDLFGIEALLSGSEIQQITGLAPGPEIGRLKRELLRAQLQGSVRSNEEAIAFVSQR